VYRLSKLWTIALYEAKSIIRSKLFIIFSFLSISILILLNIYFFVYIRSTSWQFRGIPSSIPYLNLILLNIAQAVIAVFMASDFLAHEKKMNTIDSIYTRSITNAEYVLGKLSGVLIVFLCINIIILFLSFVINVVFVDDVPFVPITYLFYLLLISIPTLIYIFGLTFFFMSLIKSQPITLFILLGYITATFSLLSTKFHYLFDFQAFNLPFLYSDFIGFGNNSTLLMQRSIYLFLGLGLIFTAVLLFKRLPQSKLANLISLVLVLFFIGAAGQLGNMYLSKISEGRDLRREMRLLNKQFADNPRISITGCKLDLIHHGNEIEVNADLTLKNNTAVAIDNYVFSLNPGMKIKKITSYGKDLGYNRDLHIITVQPAGKNLQPEHIDSLTIHYSGKINEEACNVDIDESVREKSYKIILYNIAKRHSFITNKYVLLTQENLWYPVAGVPFCSISTNSLVKDFVNFELTVKTDKKLIAISQGEPVTISEGEFLFKPEIPLPKISLVIGEYNKRSIKVDGITYNLYTKTGHDYFIKFFDGFSTKLPDQIKAYKEYFDNRLNLNYPFKRFSLIEVPIQFYSYDSNLIKHSDTVQPEQVFLHENGILAANSDFKWWQYVRMNKNETMTPEEIQTFRFRNFITNNLSGVNRSRRYGIVPQYIGFVNYFNSDEYPIFYSALEHYLRSSLYIEYGYPAPKTAACLALMKHSLPEILSDPDKKDIITDVLTLKMSYLFALLRAELGKETFNNFMVNFLSENRFKIIEVNDFIDAIQEQFGFNLKPHLDQWYNQKQLPGFLISDVTYGIVLDENKNKYHVNLTVYNPEPVDGLIHIEIPVQGGSVEEQIIQLKGGQSKEIGFVLDQPPSPYREARFNTLISRNLPTIIFKPFIRTGSNQPLKLFHGERIISPPLKPINKEEIIVDNEDPGFKILTRSKESLLKKLLHKKRELEEYYTGLYRGNNTKEWWPNIEHGYYGIYRQSAHKIKSGEGEQQVQWEAEISENGIYDIFYYTPFANRTFQSYLDVNIIEDLNFIVYHDTGIDNVNFILKKSEQGWIKLGTYDLSQGTAKIILTDKSYGGYVYADAVKWVKK
jgi:ABC-type transport system involved in multi-copper enzyme maturation permease subunit